MKFIFLVGKSWEIKVMLDILDRLQVSKPTFESVELS